MKRTLLGALASLSLASMAFAGGDSSLPKSTSTQQEDTSLNTPATGGSGSSGTSSGTLGNSDTMGGSTAQTPPPQDTLSDKSGMASGNELTGKVVKAERKLLYVEHMGAVVPLKIDNKTKFEDTLKSSKDLKQGQEIRASFTVENGTTNLATTVGLASGGTGGSGLSTDVNQDSTSAPVPSIPPADMGNNGTLPEPERSPSTPLPEEPGTPNPTY